MNREPLTYDTNAAFWVEIIRNRRDKYREELTNSAVLNAVGPVRGLSVLDAGCGEGYLSRELAGQGGTVTGVDSSAELIHAAQAHESASVLPVSFDVGSVDSLPYENGSFDLVLCNHLLNDLQDPAQALKEFARVLRSRGRVVILMLHPCFYNEHAERSDPRNNLPTNTYFQARRISQKFEVDGLQSPVASTTWLHPLEFYTEALRGAGFVITSLTEPHPTQQMIEESEWWRTAFSRPLLMLITAELR